MKLTELGQIYAKMYPNFEPWEFECRCEDDTCKKNGMEFYFMAAIQDLRLQVDFPLIPTSGYRCDIMNRAVGGKRNSMHLRGLAADITISHLTGSQIHLLLSKAFLRFNGIGIYKDFIHLDLRPPNSKTVWFD